MASNKIVEINQRKVLEDDLTPAQAYFLSSKKRYMWFCGGRGVGKTHIGARYVYRQVRNNSKTRGLICANTYDQLHSATLPPVLKYLNDMGMAYVIDKMPPPEWGLEIQFKNYRNILTTKNGHHIFLRSLDNPEFIRGIEIGWAWIDEISSTTKDAWDIIVACLRHPESTSYQIRVTGTPDGDNWTWNEFKKAYSDKPEISKHYGLVFMSTRENPHLPEGFVDALEASYDPRTAAQELDGRIVVDQESNIYYEYKPDYHIRNLIGYNPHKPIVFCWDFNSGKDTPMSTVIAQEHEFSDGTKFVQIIDEFVLFNSNTPAMCDEFLRKYADIHKSKIIVYGDRTGASSSVGVNDYEVIHTKLSTRFHVGKIHIHEFSSNMTEIDRRQAVNAMLMNARGQVRLFVHPMCKELLEDLRSLRPNKDGKIDKKDPKRSHTSDAMGYYIAREFEIGRRIEIMDIVTNLGHR